MIQTHIIHAFDDKRGEDQLIVYTQGERTGTNQYGWEACVQDGRVIRCGRNNSVIPQNGFVVSGHGKAMDFLASNVQIGCKITLDAAAMLLTVEKDALSDKLHAEQLLSGIKERLELCRSANEPIDENAVRALISGAENDIAAGAYDAANEKAEQAYYLTAFSKENEIRGVWHRPFEHSDAEVEATVRRFKDAGFTQLLIETNYEGYANALKCASECLPVRKGYEDFDVIDSFIRAGKKFGIEIHAWFEDFFYGVESTGCPMMDVHPEWMAKRKDGGLLHDAWDEFYFLNPADPEVREYLVEHCRKLLDNYDFDGLQLDYIRYPLGRGLERTAGYEERTKELFWNECGINLDGITSDESEEWKTFTAWRAEKVTSYVQRIRALVDEYKQNGRNILLSTAVFGDPYEAVRLKCQNWQYWVKQNWLDLIYPMAYMNDAEDVKEQIAYMVSQYGEAPNVSGIAPMYNHLPVIESTKQVEACRQAGASGVAFFETRACTDEQLSKLKSGVFRR